MSVQIDVRGANAYAATGNRVYDPKKPTVVFIHGVGQDHTIWVLPVRYFARHDHNVLSIDLPGHGVSEGPLLESIEEMADWVVEFLDAVGVNETALVGHSMGALVALEVAARHQERVRSLTLVSISVPLAVTGPLMGAAENHDHEALEMLTYWGHGRAAQIGGSPTPGIWMVGSAMRLWEEATPESIHTDLTACHGYAMGLERGSVVTCPTLLLLGERDRMAPARLTETLQEVLVNQRTIIFEGAGHSLLSERSDPVLDQLIQNV